METTVRSHPAWPARTSGTQRAMVDNEQQPPREPLPPPHGFVSFGIVCTLAFVGSLVYAVGAVAGAFSEEPLYIVAAFVLAASAGFLAFATWTAMFLMRKGYTSVKDFRRDQRGMK